MKKNLLIAGLALAAAFSASADQFRVLPGNRIDLGKTDAVTGMKSFAAPASMKVMKAPAAAPSYADGTMNYQLFDQVYSALGFGQQFAEQQGYAFEITKEMTALYGGSKVTEVTFYTGVDMANSTNSKQVNAITDYEVFLTYDLEAEPFYTQACTASTDGFAEVNVTLDTPQTVDTEKPLFIGVHYYTKKKEDYPIVIDGMPHTSDAGGWVMAPVTNSSGSYIGMMDWDNIAAYYGFVCMSATLSGELPQNLAEPILVSAPAAVGVNTPFQLSVGFKGVGANAITSLEMEYTVGTSETQTLELTAQTGMPFGQEFGYVIQDAVCAELGGNVPVTVKVTKVNGVENEWANNTMTTSLVCLPADWTTKRNVVIEEFTGTWCGWCPQGIVAMEAIRKTPEYADGSLIPIAVHQGDNMAINDYQPIINIFVSGFPSALANRAADVQMNGGSTSDIMAKYKEQHALLSLANVGLDVVYNDETRAFDCDVATEFAVDMAGASDVYALTIVLTRDGVGPYTQSNYYAGGGSGRCGGWESKGSKVSYTFDDVASAIDGTYGIENSIPADVKARETYHYTTSVKLPSAVNDLSKVHAVAMLINKNTLEIENAIMKSNILSSSVSEIGADAAAVIEALDGAIAVSGNEGEAAIYTPAGVCVASFNGDATVAVPAGIYVVKAGSTVLKVVVK